MAEIDDNRLVNLALGLSDDPELAVALRSSPELRERLQQVTAELRGLDRELQKLQPQASRRPLGEGRWRILVPYDDTARAQQAVATAAALAATSDGEVVVFHVQVLEPPGQGWPIETRTDAAQLVDCVIAHLLDEGVKAAGALGSASRRAIASEIVSAAASRGADLIVMGSRRRSLLARLFFGSLTHEVMRHAPCPVVIVR